MKRVGFCWGVNISYFFMNFLFVCLLCPRRVEVARWRRFFYGVGKAELSCVEFRLDYWENLLDCVWWWVHQIEQKCVIFLVLVFFCVFEFQFCMFQLNFCDMQYQVVAIKYDRFSMVFAHTHYSFLFLLFFCTGRNFLFPTFFCLRIQIMQECLRHFSNCLIMLHKTDLGIFFLRRFFCMRTNWTFRAIILSKSSPNGSTCVKNDNWKVTNFEKMY